MYQKTNLITQTDTTAFCYSTTYDRCSQKRKPMAWFGDNSQARGRSILVPSREQRGITKLKLNLCSPSCTLRSDNEELCSELSPSPQGLSNDLRTDEQPDCSWSDYLQQSSPGGKPGLSYVSQRHISSQSWKTRLKIGRQVSCPSMKPITADACGKESADL